MAVMGIKKPRTTDFITTKEDKQSQTEVLEVEDEGSHRDM